MVVLRDFRLTLRTEVTMMVGGAGSAGEFGRGPGTLERSLLMSSVPWRVVVLAGMERLVGRVRQIVDRGSDVFTSVGREMAWLGKTPHTATVRRLRACL